MDLKWLAEQVAGGRKDRDIAEELGIAVALVGYYRRKLGMRGQRRPRAFVVDPAWLTAQVAAGRSDADIARELKVRPSAVGYWRRTLKIDPRSKSERGRTAYRERFPEGRFGVKAANWRGGRMRVGNGYIRIHLPDHPHANRAGYVYEHRYVMEQKLGRLLEKKEVVDHLDRNRSNNAPENLRLHANRSQHVKDHFSARDQLLALVAQIRALPTLDHYLNEAPRGLQKIAVVRWVQIENLIIETLGESAPLGVAL